MTPTETLLAQALRDRIRQLELMPDDGMTPLQEATWLRALLTRRAADQATPQPVIGASELTRACAEQLLILCRSKHPALWSYHEPLAALCEHYLATYETTGPGSGNGQQRQAPSMAGSIPASSPILNVASVVDSGVTNRRVVSVAVPPTVQSPGDGEAVAFIPALSNFGPSNPEWEPAIKAGIDAWLHWRSASIGDRRFVIDLFNSMLAAAPKHGAVVWMRIRDNKPIFSWDRDYIAANPPFDWLPLYTNPPAPSAPLGGAVAVVDEGEEGLFVEILYGENGSPLKLGDKLYTAPTIDKGPLVELERQLRNRSTDVFFRDHAEILGDYADELRAVIQKMFP